MGMLMECVKAQNIIVVTNIILKESSWTVAEVLKLRLNAEGAEMK